MKVFMFFLLLFFVFENKASAQSNDRSQDSSYTNWYYDSREKLYQGLKNQEYDIVFFGNSITERGPWDELIGVKYKVGNRGIGGDNTFGMKARIKDVVSRKPKKLFLMMGINDVGRGIDPKLTLYNYEEIISIIKRESPSTKIYIQSVLPMNDQKLAYDYLKNKEGVVRFLGESVKDLAKKYNITYVDVKSVLADDYVLKDKYTSDGIHINTEAYTEWVKYLKDKKYL
jgi:lysophospholipase L1-like esterase